MRGSPDAGAGRPRTPARKKAGRGWSFVSPARPGFGWYFPALIPPGMEVPEEGPPFLWHWLMQTVGFKIEQPSGVHFFVFPKHCIEKD